MKSYQILYPGAYPVLKIDLDQNQTLKAESGAMVAMDTTIDVEGKMEGGILGGLGRMLAGENFFFQTLKAVRGAGEVILAPTAPGDIICIELDGSVTYSVQKDGFLAGSQELQVETKMQNLTKGLFSGEGFFILKIGGVGKLFVNSFGAIHKISLPAGKEYIIDNAHLVAWPNTTNFRVEKASKGWISSITSGEGLVTRFIGPGEVYIQTRNTPSFGNWISRFIPRKG
jgi:uncharacterized protein (TIGR00266 family)